MAKARSAKKKSPPAPDVSLVDFDHPPVNEVVCGVGFRAPKGFDQAYIGLWWSEHRKQFPKIRPAAPIVGHAEGKDFPFAGRSMFVNDDETKIVQIQQTRFYYNWIRLEDKQIYPRFHKVYKEFTTLLMEFEDFIAKNNIEKILPIEYALTYVNYVPQGSMWQTLSDIHRIFPDMRWRKAAQRRYLSEPTDINFRYVFPIKDRPGQLTAIVQRGTRKSDQVPVLRFEIQAQATDADGLPEHSPASMSKWFRAAREAIVLGFLDMTTETAQKKLWGRRD